MRNIHQIIDKLSLISLNCETTHMQVGVDDNADNGKHENPIQIKCGKCEQLESEKQDTEAQSQHNAGNTAKPNIVTNPTVMGNNKTIKITMI